MALSGGILGLALAFWGKDLLVVFIAGNLPTLDPVTIDYRVLGFNLGLALLTGFAFGLAPAFQAVGIPLNESLKEGGRSVTEGRRHHGLGNGLVICEIALALVLLIGAGLLLKSFLQLRGLDPGFKTDHILRLTINLTPSKYPKPADQSRFFQQVLERVSGLAGVQSAGIDDGLDLSGVDGNTVTGCKIEGRPETFDADWAAVSSDFFRVVGIPLIKGRAFAESDREGAPSVVIVNESFVRHYFPNENCLGKRMDNWVREHDRLTIVGVVPDVRGYGTKKQNRPQLYLPYLQDGHAYMDLLVRTAGDPMDLAAAVRSQIRSVDADQPPYDIMTLEQGLREFLAPQRINMLLLATFAALALALASIGIYGVISYSVSRRTHEIGVRAALGAQPRDVLRLVLGQGMLLVGIGLGIGLAASFALSRVISSMLYGVSATDPLTFAGIALLLSIVAWMACYIPARRATKIDPMDALRRE